MSDDDRIYIYPVNPLGTLALIFFVFCLLVAFAIQLWPLFVIGGVIWAIVKYYDTQAQREANEAAQAAYARKKALEREEARQRFEQEQREARERADEIARFQREVSMETVRVWTDILDYVAQRDMGLANVLLRGTLESWAYNGEIIVRRPAPPNWDVFREQTPQDRAAWALVREAVQSVLGYGAGLRLQTVHADNVIPTLSEERRNKMKARWRQFA